MPWATVEAWKGRGVSARIRRGEWEGAPGGGEGAAERWGRMYFAGFVLRDFVLGVLLAVFAFAVGAPGFGDVDLDAGSC